MVGCIAGNDVVREVFKAKLSAMGMLQSNPGFYVHKHNKVSVKLFQFEIVVAFALREVDVVLEDWGACLDLHPKLSSRIVGFDDEIATGKVGSETAGEVCRDAMHPALGIDRSLTNLPV